MITSKTSTIVRQFLAAVSMSTALQAVGDVPVPQAIQDAPQNSWIKLNTNNFSDAWAPDGLTYNNTKSVIEAWSSFAWDSNRGNLILWGGGHANYLGNEVYLWNHTTGLWSRGSLSSASEADPNVTARFQTADGPLHSPVSMHTYDGNIFLPRLDRFLVFGGPQYNAGGPGPDMYDEGTLRITGPYLWDPSKADPWKVGGQTGSHVISATYPAGSILGGEMWQNRDSRPTGILPGADRQFSATFSANADEGGKDVVYLSGSGGLWRYTIVSLNDPTQDTYEQLGRNNLGSHPHGAGAFNAGRRLWVELRGSEFIYYDLSGSGIVNAQHFTGRIAYASAEDEGTFTFGSLAWPTIGDRFGLEYDPGRDRFLLWEGTNEVWELKAPADLAAGTWILKRISPAITGAPYPDRFADSVSTENSYYAWRGAAGKWKYVSDWDAFIGVYHPVQGDVWVFKPTPAGVDCSPVLSPNSVELSGGASTSSLSVTLPLACERVAYSDSTWLTVTSDAGMGSGVVTFEVTVNNGPARAATLTIGDAVFVVSQASNCTYSISPTTVELPFSAQSGALAVTTQNGCTWVTNSNTAWLTVTSGATGVGSGMVAYAASTNTGIVRSGSITVNSEVISVVQAETPVPTPPGTNVALQSQGGVATASTSGSGFSAAAINNGDRKGQNCQSGGCWVDATEGVNPDWAQVNFSGPKTIDRVEVITMQDNWTAPVEPTAQMTFAAYGIVDYEVQYWTGTAWAAVPNGTIVGNNKVWRTITFPALTTDKIRVWVTKVKYAAPYTYSRIVEVEAWTPGSAPANVSPTVGLTAPTGGAVYTAPASVMLSANAADSDGSVSKVEFFAGATKLGEALAAPYNFTWTGVVAGSYTLTAVATDNQGATTTSAPVNITVNTPANVSPTVGLTAPTGGAVYTAPASVMLSANAADSDGSVSKVEFFAGATKLGEALAAPYNFTWTGVVAGSYTLTAVATDNQGATTTSAPVNITVNAAGGGGTTENVALQSNGGIATASSTHAAGFSAAAINNGDRKGQNCQSGGCWVDATEGVNPDWAQVNFSGPKTIDRVEVITMQDNWTAPVEPTAQMTFAAYGIVDYEVQYWTGTAWAAVPNGTIVGNNKVWRTITFPALTTDKIRVWVTKVQYAAPYTYSRIVEVEAWTPGSAPANVSPTVGLTAPTGGAVYTAPASVMLSANAADSDGSVSKVEFFAGATKLGEALAAPYNFTWTGVVAGSYTLTAVATDNQGATTTSAPVNITVNTPANVSPTVGLTAPTGGAVYTAPASVMLSANAADSDGSVSKVEFFAGATKLGEALAAPYNFTWTGVVAGSYTLTAVATDNQGATTTSAPVNITVNAAGGGGTTENVALQSNGGIATASSTHAAGFSAAAINNGDRKGQNCQSGGCWVDATEGVNPDWAQVNFSGPKTIDRVEVITMQDNWTAPVEPTAQMTFAAYGIVDYEVQYWTGTAWAAVPNGTIVGNNKVWRTITFPALTTDKIRVWVTKVQYAAPYTYSRIVEVEAWTPGSAPANVSPTVGLTAPTGGAVYTAPASVMLSANAADSDGSVSKVEFFAGATKLGEALAAPYNFTWTGVVAGSYTLTAVATDNQGATTTSAPVNITVNAAGGGGTTENVALQSNGGIATASSTHAAGFSAAAINNGDRKGQNCQSGGCWVDATEGVNPDWAQVNFSGPKTIDRVEVITMQDNWTAPVEPTAQMTFAAYGIVDYEVQYWTGTAWAAVPNGTIVGNNKVWRTITFPALTTDKIRVWVTKVQYAAPYTYSRIVEVEAWSIN